MKFGELIRAKRQALGLTLEEVGDAIGSSKGYIHGLESGRDANPGLLLSVRLSVALGINLQLMGAAVIEDHLEAGKGESS